MKLHLGCGTRYIPGWVHVDQVKHEHIDYVCSVDKLPFKDNSADIIYSSHVLEYFDYQEAEGIVLPEWKRVLKPGGILRLAVPDFEKIAGLYNSLFERGLSTKMDVFIGLLFGRQLYNNKTCYHKCVYDEKKLSSILCKVGFKRLQLWDWRQTEHSHIDDCSQAYLPHMDKENGTLMSLNLEAVK